MGKDRGMEERICNTCEKSYIPKRKDQVYCCAECRNQGFKKYLRAYGIEAREKKRQEKVEKVKKKEKPSSLVDIAVEARKAGMTYGQYVAKMGL